MRSRRVGGSSYTFVVQSRRIPLCFINFTHKSSFNINSVIPINLTSSVHLCIVTAFRGSISAFGFSNLVSVCRCDQPGGSRNPKSACVCDSDLHLRLNVCVYVRVHSAVADRWLAAPTAHNNGWLLLACVLRQNFRSSVSCVPRSGPYWLVFWMRLRLVLYPVLDWTGYHINACGAHLGGSFRVPVFFPETRTRVNMDQ